MRLLPKGWRLPAMLLAAVIALSAGTVFAHEGREVEGFRLIAGWAVEPAYEAHKNAVQLRVTRLASGDDHHGSTVDEADVGGVAGSGDDAMGEHHAMTVEAERTMSVEVTAEQDSVSGVNVHISAQGFTFTPENVDQGHAPGEGHAHIYVDGVKLSRAFSPWVYLGDLEPGMREIRVTLNANGHSDYTWNGSLVEAETHVMVPELNGMPHAHGPTLIEADSLMSVSLDLVPGVDTGANLYLETHGFTFAPEDAGGAHVAVEGHAHVYVNGVKIGRIYGNAFPLTKLAEGENEVRVTLNTNDHGDYTWNGELVEAVGSIHIQPGKGGPGYGAGRPSVQDIGMTAATALQQSGSQEAPVAGLQDSLLVEVTHVSSETSRVLSFHAVPGDPGLYTADLIPTAPGVYEFRVSGIIEGTRIDETFVSKGGGGDFDDVQSAAALQFPVELPETRELESAIRGALQTAQQAQDSALAVETGGETGVLVFLALTLAGVGNVTGLLALYLAVRRR